MQYRKGVFIVVYAREKDKIYYLLLKRKLHWKGWEFPKGGVENESILHAVRRELFEETGKKAGKIIKLNFSGKYKYDKKLRDREGFTGQSFKLFAVEVKKGKIKLDKREHSGYKWQEFREAVKKLKWLNQKQALRIVEKRI